MSCIRRIDAIHRQYQAIELVNKRRAALVNFQVDFGLRRGNVQRVTLHTQVNVDFFHGIHES